MLGADGITRDVGGRRAHKKGEKLDIELEKTETPGGGFPL